MRISKQPSKIQILIDKYRRRRWSFGSLITNDGKCTQEIKFIIFMATARFNRKMALFTSKSD